MNESMCELCLICLGCMLNDSYKVEVWALLGAFGNSLLTFGVGSLIPLLANDPVLHWYSVLFVTLATSELK